MLQELIGHRYSCTLEKTGARLEPRQACKRAVGRKTTRTRIEDRAYLLMGIFGVYIPPIYGEEMHVFTRLQEILKLSGDRRRPFSVTSMGLLVHLPLLSVHGNIFGLTSLIRYCNIETKRYVGQSEKKSDRSNGF
jgi:hypothetical protein